MQTWIMHFCTYVVPFYWFLLLTSLFIVSIFTFHLGLEVYFIIVCYFSLQIWYINSYRYEFVEKHSGIAIFIRVKYSISVIKNIFFRKSHETSIIVSFIHESIKIYPSIVSSNISIIYYPNFFLLNYNNLNNCTTYHLPNLIK